MPRKNVRNAFADDRDIRTDAPTPSPASDLGGLLPKNEKLPPPPARRPDTEPTPVAPETTPTSETGEASAPEPKPTSSKPRGVGGRPTAGKEPAGGIAKIPARVPADLYAAALPLVKGIGKPSWGQLIAWTCQDHADQVLDHVLERAGGGGAPGRKPRGQNRKGTAALQVTARLDATELPAVDEVMKRAQSKAERKVTRTMVVLAALTVAANDTTAA